MKHFMILFFIQNELICHKLMKKRKKNKNQMTHFHACDQTYKGTVKKCYYDCFPDKHK